MFQTRMGALARPKARHIANVCRLNNSARYGLHHNRNNPMQAICKPLVNLARKPAPMTAPSANQCQTLRLASAVQHKLVAQAQKKTLNESMVIRMEPTAKSGRMAATSRHHRAVRSS